MQAARRAAPREACGLLLGNRAHVRLLVEVRNRAARAGEFELDALDAAAAERAARGAGLELLGYFHSHPLGDATPSALDRAADAFPGCGPRLHLIVTPAGRWRLYCVRREGWESLVPSLVDGEASLATTLIAAHG